MKIAHKLQVDLITKHIVKHIEGDWPQTLDEWDALCQPLAFWHSEGHQPKEELPEPIATIIFARTFDVPKVLPVAFYELSRRRYRHDWDVEHLRNFEKGGRRVAARWSLLPKRTISLSGDYESTSNFSFTLISFSVTVILCMC